MSKAKLEIGVTPEVCEAQKEKFIEEVIIFLNTNTKPEYRKMFAKS